MNEYPEEGCYCEFVSFRPCLWCMMNKRLELTKQEAAITKLYKDKLKFNKHIPKELLLRVNDIYEKYPDFNIGSY